MGVRPIPRNSRSVTGRLPVAGQMAVSLESSLERDFAMLAVFRKDFVAIEEQPVRIPVGDRGRSYIPDFLVTWAGPSPADLVEVKYVADLEANRELLAPKFTAAERYARGRGWCFRVATELDIRTPLLANAKFLLPYRHRVVDPGLCARLLGIAASFGPITAESFMKAAFPAAEDRPAALPALWHLLATFRLLADLEAPLTMDTVLTIGDARHDQA